MIVVGRQLVEQHAGRGLRQGLPYCQLRHRQQSSQNKVQEVPYPEQVLTIFKEYKNITYSRSNILVCVIYVI